MAAVHREPHFAAVRRIYYLLVVVANHLMTQRSFGWIGMAQNGAVVVVAATVAAEVVKKEFSYLGLKITVKILLQMYIY